jgi:CheY-like chemotaxis protein/HPt (histidine-containing phosphotransfer) domain-containing protein
MTSKLGVGSTFWFEITLPLGTRPPEDLDAFSHDLLPGMRVLVVDDNPTNRLILESQLTLWRLQPDAVEGADAALSQMRHRATQGRPYDIAVLDMCMPRIDGLQLAQAISADPVLRRTKMIMLTSSFHVETAALRQAGVRAWLTKPVRNAELYDRLMRLMAPDVASAAPSPTAHTKPATEGALHRVLVVEDNALNQLVAETVVSQLGYQVDIVANGVEALAAIETVPYSALLMDCHMPIMDGFEATRQIRRREGSARRTPIIAMTAAAMHEDRQRCLDAGMDDYVSKPVDVTALQTVLARWIPLAPSPAASRFASSTPVAALTMASTTMEPAIDKKRVAVLRKLGSLKGTDMVTKIADIFTRESASSLAILWQAAHTGAVHDLEQAAHKLRGASGTIGAGSVAQLCQQLEDGAHTITQTETNHLLDRLEIELTRTTLALDEERGTPWASLHGTVG